LIPSRVSPLTSATPGKVTETLITVAPSKALFPTGVIEKLPPVSGENSHFPLYGAAPAPLTTHLAGLAIASEQELLRHDKRRDPNSNSLHQILRSLTQSIVVAAKRVSIEPFIAPLV
jgi:hypothetical protein